MSQYATVAEFARFGLPTDATAGFTSDAIEDFLKAASAIVDGMIEARGYAPPLPSWDKDLSSAVCKLAAYDVVFHAGGANPADPAHAAIVMSRDWAERHVEKVAKGLAKFANTTRAKTMVAQVIADTNDDGSNTRGW